MNSFSPVFMLVTLRREMIFKFTVHRAVNIYLVSPAFTDWLYTLPTPKPPNPTPPMPVHSELIAPLGGQSEELYRATAFLPHQETCFLSLDTSELEFDRPGPKFICCAFEGSSSVRKVKNMSRKILRLIYIF